jgi:HEAT repeat protein
MKKLIILVLLAGIAGGGFLMYSKIQTAGELADDYEKKDLLPGEIVAALGGDDPAARADAAEQIEKLDPEKRKTVLLALTRDESASIRLLAVSLLTQHHATDAQVVGDLLAVAKTDLDIDVQQAAFAALGQSGDERALKLAITVLSDLDADLPLKLEAVEMLDRLTGRTTKGDLEEALEDAMDAADDLGMSWDEWLTTHGPTLSWDAEKGRFVDKAGE